MTIQLQFIIQCQILCILCLLCIFMKTVIIVRLFFDHFHIIWDYTQKWINGKIKMMMMAVKGIFLPPQRSNACLVCVASLTCGVQSIAVPVPGLRVGCGEDLLARRIQLRRP